MANTTATTTMSENAVNGEKPVSLTFNHIASYPLPAELINVYESHPLGKKSIEIFHALHSSLSHNLSPYLAIPYSVLAPYLEHADKIGNSTLSNIDERFPAIKETDLNTARSHAHAIALLPFQLAHQSRDYVLDTYQSEYSRSRNQQGIYRTASSIISTELRIASDILHAVAGYLGPKRDEFAHKYEQMREQVGAATEKYTQIAAEKVKQLEVLGNQKAAKAEEFGKEKKQQVEVKSQELANGQ